jgi:hypothetical protein
MTPTVVNQLVDRFLLKQALKLTEEVKGDQFLVSKHGLGVIAQALKTGFRTSKVNATGKQIKLDELIFHGKKILLISLFACHLNP